MAISQNRTDPFGGSSCLPPRLPPGSGAVHGIARTSRGLARFAALATGCSLLVVAGWTQPTGQPPAPKNPDILIINSYAPGYEWSDDEQAGILTVLKARHPEIEPVVQYLDFKRFTDPAREAWLLADVVDKCRNRPPQLIITLDNAAFDFALKHRTSLGADVPLIFGGLNRFTPDMIAGQTNITGVSEESDFRGTFELIRHLTPAARNVLVIGNRTESSIEKRKAFEALMLAYANRYRFEFLEDWTNAQLLERLSRADDGTVGLILDVTRDASGHNNYNDGAFSAALASRPRVPVFITSHPPGSNDWSVNPWDGIGGGLVVAEVHGAAVGELALRVLAGARADALPVVRHSPQRMEVDFRHMKRFGFALDQLPPGTKVLNAPVTFYQVNRSRLILAGIVFLVLCAVIVTLVVNIFLRRRAERALRRAEDQLRSAQKMEAIGLLAGGVAHDFNNILQVIRGHCSFLLESLPGNSPQREDAEIIQNAAGRAAQLTSQLLVFSRKQPLQPQPLDPNVLVTDTTKMLRRLLGEHIELQFTPLAEEGLLLADRGQLEQLLLNLCVNARDAMPAGGRIVIEMRKVQLAPADCAPRPGLKPGSHLLLTVGDTGTGMAPAALEHLFEPFFTTKAVGKGTGLGLSVVYGIVHQHGGEITVYSEVGKGTVFKILLPMPAVAATDRPEPVVARLPLGSGTLLLAEDDEQVRAFACRILEQHGYRVVAAADGQAAEALFAQHADAVRLAILDVVMPRRSGRQVYDAIKARRHDLPVLFCSGYSADLLPPGMAPETGVMLLNKPYAGHELLAAVHHLLGGQPPAAAGLAGAELPLRRPPALDASNLAP